MTHLLIGKDAFQIVNTIDLQGNYLYIWFIIVELPALNVFKIGANTLNEVSTINLKSIFVIYLLYG